MKNKTDKRKEHAHGAKAKGAPVTSATLNETRPVRSGARYRKNF